MWHLALGVVRSRLDRDRDSLLVFLSALLFCVATAVVLLQILWPQHGGHAGKSIHSTWSYIYRTAARVGQWGGAGMQL